MPKGVCEYDVMGAIRGEPVDLVKCETVDLYVPATAEIVIEGYLQIDPGKGTWKGPSPSSPAMSPAKDARSRPFASPPSPTATTRSCAARSKARCPARFSENEHLLVDHAGVDRLERARPRRRARHHRVWCPPVQTGINLLIRMKSSYRNQAKQAANAIWGSSAAHVRYKHITVVDDDIDIHDYAAVDWAIAHRVNAGEDDIVIMPSTFGAGLDPSTRKRDRNPALFGTGKWNRVLIDATMNLDYDPDPELDGARFPPRCGRSRTTSTPRWRAGPSSARETKECVVGRLRRGFGRTGPWSRRPPGMISRATVGITSRLQIGDSSMPPTITQASGCCTCEPMPVESAAGHEADAGREAGHEDLPHAGLAGLDDRLSVPMPSSRSRRM